MNKKEELQRQLDEITLKEDNEMIDKAYPALKEYEGKYFKVKNSYGNGKDWWIYIKVTSVERSDMYVSGEKVLSNYTGVHFQTDVAGRIHVELNYRGYIHSLEKEISEKVFYKELAKIKETINII